MTPSSATQPYAPCPTRAWKSANRQSDKTAENSLDGGFTPGFGFLPRTESKRQASTAPWNVWGSRLIGNPLAIGAWSLFVCIMLPSTASFASEDPNHLLAESDPVIETPAPSPPTEAFALFAGGCFWCMEPPFDELDGVLETLSGYAGGTVDNPTYKQVTAGGTGHLEVLQVRYDPSKIGYKKLLEVFWRNIDFLDDGGQFCDRGVSYQPAIFALDERQRDDAERSRDSLKALFPKLNTPIREAAVFWPAEDYHQDYYRKNPLRYKYYRWGCGRDARLEELAEQRQSLETEGAAEPSSAESAPED